MSRSDGDGQRSAVRLGSDPIRPRMTPLADTGGEPLWLIVGLMTLSAAGAALIMVGRRRSRRLP